MEIEKEEKHKGNEIERDNHESGSGSGSGYTFYSNWIECLYDSGFCGRPSILENGYHTLKTEAAISEDVCDSLDVILIKTLDSFRLFPLSPLDHSSPRQLQRRRKILPHRHICSPNIP